MKISELQQAKHLKQMAFNAGPLGQAPVEFSGSPVRDHQRETFVADDRLYRRTHKLKGIAIGAGAGAIAGGVLSHKLLKGSRDYPVVSGALGGALAGGAIGSEIGQLIRKKKADPVHPMNRRYVEAMR